MAKADNSPELVYERFQKGDPLSDLDLNVGIAHFKVMADLLYSSGPVFRLAAIEAGRVARRFEEYRAARKEK